MKAFVKDAEVIGVDNSRARREESRELFSIETRASVEEAAAEFSPAAGIVCSPPLTHAEITKTLLSKGMHVFSEINLVDDGYDENMALAKKKGLVLFLSSTPMYRKEIEYITEVALGQSKLCYRYHVGQYLPDWHPWEEYTDFFVSDRRTNGCRELFAIELPWMVNAFGEVESFHAKAKRLSGLSIDFPDCFLVTLRHKGGVTGQLMVDIVSRKAVRELELIAEDIYLRWSGAPDSLYHYDVKTKENRNIACYDSVLQDKRYSGNIIENAYAEELTAFFGLINGVGAPRHTFEADMGIIALLDAIEGANE